MNLLFDLDGTLLNSEEGITKCAQYALSYMDIQETDLKKLRRFIGPPLRGQFMETYGLSKEQVEEVMLRYRERYGVKGMYESELYPYVEETLKFLKEKGYTLALASSKNETACIDILKYYEIDKYFDLVGGATNDGRISRKADVLKMVMEKMGSLDPADYVLIGDTKYDAMGAKAVGMDCIGVTYGFGTREELEDAGVIHVCGSLRELVSYLEKFHKTAKGKGRREEET